MLARLRIPMTSLRIERITDAAGLETVVPEWEALDRQLRPRTPFTSPLWNLLWWRHFRAQEAFVRDELFAHVVRGEAGQLLAVAPMMVTYRPARGPLRARQLHFFGADVNLTEVRGLVCSRVDQEQMIRTLTRHFIERAEEWDWLEWPGIDDGGSLDPCDPAAPSPDGIPLYYVPLPSSWEELKAGLSRNTKEALRKCYNSLKRAGRDWVFRVVQAPGEVDEALNTFYDLHRARSAVTGTVNHPDVFSSRTAREFFTAYAREMAERRQLCVFQLEIGGKTVAARVGFVLGEDLYLYYSGYDPAWGRFSVMTTVVAEAIKWAIQTGLKVVNLSTGRDIAKLRWRPTEMVLGRMVMPAPTVRGRLSLGAFKRITRETRGDSRLGRLLAWVRRSPA